MVDRPARLLVGSSSEGLDIARELQRLVEPNVKLTLWNEDFFTPGELTLETLERKTRTFDGGVILATADDHVVSRGVDSDAIRDNLLFEYGLFVSTFGRRKALLVIENRRTTRVPSDLLGLSCLSFERTDPLESGLIEAARRLSGVAAELARDVVDPGLANSLDQVVRAFLWEFQTALGSHDLGLHVWLVDPRSEPETLLRVARARSSPKAPLGRSYERGNGLVGYCWETGSPVFVDFSQEPYRSATPEAWPTYGAEIRAGMDFSLLQESRERFRVVGVAPIVSHLSSGLRFLGCLSYNVGRSASEGVQRTIELESAINRTCEIIRILIEGLSLR